MRWGNSSIMTDKGLSPDKFSRPSQYNKKKTQRNEDFCSRNELRAAQ